MAILIADTKLETETDAWYQFYVDKIVRQKLLRMRQKIAQRPARPLLRHRRIC